MLSINFKGGLHRMKFTKGFTKDQKEWIEAIAGGVVVIAILVELYILLWAFGG